MHWKKAEAVMAVVLLLVLGMAAFRPSMTGFVPAKTMRASVTAVVVPIITFRQQVPGG